MQPKPSSTIIWQRCLLLLARPTFAAAVKRWPGGQDHSAAGAHARIIEETWPADN
jgi:hypothetical protein